MPFVQKNIRQNARHCFQCVLFLKYWLFAGGGFDFCTIMWQNKRRVATSSPDILPKDGKQILTHSFSVILRIWLKIPFALSALIQENKKRTEPVIFRCFDLFFTGQICTFVPVQQIFRDGYSEQSVLDFIFLWFCPVFVPFGICLTEQNFVKLWFTNS
jgi:hypothetical protein